MMHRKKVAKNTTRHNVLLASINNNQKKEAHYGAFRGRNPR
jgi:hypothetical protein